MTTQKLHILLANTLDREGGAEQVASSLLDGYRARGHEAWLAVGVKKSLDPHVYLIDNARKGNLWSRFWWRAQKASTRLHGKKPRWGEKIRRGLALAAAPQGIIETMQGYENSHFPGTYSLLELPPQRPDILHCHSLQRGYFELEALPFLSKQVATVLTLHDAWLLSGHCTHPFGCEKWLTGCGHCPDLAIPPALLRDGTARNWQRKRDIFKQSRLWIAADSKWLLQKANAAALPCVDSRVIYPGVDLETFRRGDRRKARAELGLPQDANILLFVAHNARRNPWKDYALLKQMIHQVGALLGDKVILLVAGDPAAEHFVVKDNIWLAPPLVSAQQLATCYQAADVYVHATHVETFGLTIVEAMASGLPVVATRTAAIPEIVTHEQSGFLTTPGDLQDMVTRVTYLINQRDARRAMGQRAEQMARRFSVNNTIDAYLTWYNEILEQCAIAA